MATDDTLQPLVDLTIQMMGLDVWETKYLKLTYIPRCNREIWITGQHMGTLFAECSGNNQHCRGIVGICGMNEISVNVRHVLCRDIVSHSASNGVYRS